MPQGWTACRDARRDEAVGPYVPGIIEDWSTVRVPRALSTRSGKIVAQGGVLALVVGATLAYTHSGATVHLSIDGQQRELRSGAGTVRALLADESITLGEHDQVAPALDTTLVNGQDVVVRFGRPLTVTVDGVTTTYYTTEQSLDGALAALGIRAEGAKLSVSRSQPLGRDGLSLAVITPKKVTVTADGASRTLTSTAATVGELLTEAELTLDGDDTVSVAASTPLAAGLSVKVVRISTRTETKLEQVAYPVTRTKDATLAKGTTKVVTKGVAGTKRTTYTITLADGKVLRRTASGSTVVKEPVTAVLRVGTKPVPASASSDSGSVPSSGGGAVDSLNWPALARCESGGNPRAVNPAGYYGLYQFSLGTWRSVGGSGNPINASPAEQTARAKILYKRSGASPWPVCGRKLYT